MLTFFSGQKLFILFAVFCFILLGCSQDTELQWNQEQGYLWAELSPGYLGKTGFEQLDPSATNINFTNTVNEESVKENRNYLNGSGVAAADVDGDGWVDLYFANLDGPNKLYKNMGGMVFRDITEQAGVAHEEYNSTGVVFADVDGDSDPDLLVTSLTETNELYINDGKGKFSLKNDSGLGSSRGSNTMALADIDSDGDLDLYITNYKLKTARDIYSAEELATQNTIRKQGDSVVVIPPFDQYYGIIEAEERSFRNEYGDRDELYLNDGYGFFKKVEDHRNHFLDREGNPKGISRDWGLTARFQDVNDDGLPDLFVANDFWTPDRFWINQGKGVFKQADEFVLSSMSLSSMGVDFSDINRDGYIDFFVTEMLSADHQRRMRQLSEQMDLIDEVPQYNRNSLYLNRGDNTFAEISHYSNLEATEWSWATNFLDVDLDGYEDLIITTGHAYDYQDMDTQLRLDQRRGQAMRGGADLMQFPRLELQNKILRNNGDLTFSDRSSEWGFTSEDISLGMAYADLDNDGDPDLAMNRLNQEALIYENQIGTARIAVKLEGTPPNTDGIGAKVELRGAGVTQDKEIVAGGTYTSGPQPLLFFAADEGKSNHKISVTWPDGTESTIDSVQANRIYVIEEKTIPKKSREKKEITEDSDSTLFTDVSDRITHTHREDPYTDRNIQPMLPVKISEQGPGISWIDIDRDEDDDLVIPAGKGNRLSVFQNDGNGKFRRREIDGLNHRAQGDQTTIIGWNENNHTNLIIGSANFEQGNPNVPSAYHYLIGNQTRKEDIQGILSTTGSLAGADYDMDGDIDLFVGGSFNPANYPRNASSRLFKNENGSYQLDQKNSGKLSELGLTSGAVFFDYDQDGDPDLLISRQWDSLVLFQNEEGNFRDVSNSVGLQKYKGWWNGISTGDFNNDGKPDIIATNIGKNSVYKLDTEQPLKMYFSDLNMDGRVDIVDAYYSPELQGYVPRRRLYSFDSLPGLLRSVKSHSEFARSTVDEIFRQDFSKIPSKEINTLHNMLFINTGDGFEPSPLPVYAQFSAAFAAEVTDFDNDGNEDLFLSQNLFDLPLNIPRIDAGRGLLLKGNGTGEFEAVPGQISGIKIYGEQRGAAVADFNEDGKTDLAVAQNKGATKLYLNQADQRGIRVRLAGSESNEDAIGSSVRLVYEDGSKGPLREVQLGSGYWSQRSAVQVLGISAGKVPVAIEVQWFNGTSQTVPIEKEQADIRIPMN
jgi:hypothetical protein